MTEPMGKPEMDLAYRVLSQLDEREAVLVEERRKLLAGPDPQEAKERLNQINRCLQEIEHERVRIQWQLKGERPIDSGLTWLGTPPKFNKGEEPKLPECAEGPQVPPHPQ